MIWAWALARRGSGWALAINSSCARPPPCLCSSLTLTRHGAASEGDSTYKNFRNTQMDNLWDRGVVADTWDPETEPPHSKIAELRRICPELDELAATRALASHGNELRPTLKAVLASL